MEKNSTLQFQGYRIINSEFKIKDGENSPNYNINIDRDSLLDEDNKRIYVNIKATITDANDIVNIFIEMVGFFEFESEIDENTKEIFTKVSAPAILFPYVRAYVGSLSALSGIDTIVLPTLNLADKV